MKVILKQKLKEFLSLPKDEITNNEELAKCNEDLEYYLNGDEFSNDLCKIDDDNYFLLLKTYKR